MNQKETYFEQISQDFLKTNNKNRGFLFLIFVLIGIILLAIFLKYKKEIQIREIKNNKTILEETTQADILKELKASVGDLEIPSFHESF